MSSPRWRPVLAGAEATRADGVVKELVARLQRWLAQSPVDADERVQAALLFATFAQRFPLEEDFGALLQAAIGAAGARPRAARLWGGSVGFSHLLERALDALEADAGDVLGEFDGTLERLVTAGTEPEQFDLVRGLAGWLVYLLGRPGSEPAQRALRVVLAQLEARAVPAAGGLCWVTPGDEARLDVGVAHGVAGVAGALAMALEAGVEPQRVRPLLEGSVTWLLAQRGRAPGPCDFPAFVFASKCQTARLAWCYGDAGVATALLLAARAARNPAWEAAALETARRASAVSLPDSHVEDAGLCHGSAGLGLIFARLFNATGDALFREASARWFGRALDAFEPASPLGFRALHPVGDGTLVPADDTSLLMGTVGIALALLAATGPFEPRWDGALLTAVSEPVLP